MFDDHHHLRSRLFVPILALFLTLPAIGCTQSGEATTEESASRIDAAALLGDLEFLSSDELLGRRTGTPGNARAREYILDAFRTIGLEPVAGSFTHDFTFRGRRDSLEHQGTNVVGMLEGARFPDRYIVVTAHYDHLGVGQPDANGDSIYNGADDNASGTAALLAIARHLSEHRPAHSVIFIAFDAEEMGLQGARAFVADPPVPLESMVIDLNMDMISRNDRNELYAAGTYHYPFLKPYVERVAERASVKLLMGHDSGEARTEDWTHASDHGPFHAQGVPFLYFGVEDHPDYHQPSDEFSRIHPEFYHAAVETILDVFLEVDANPPSRPAS